MIQQQQGRAVQSQYSQMDNNRVKELFPQEGEGEDDSIPLADDDPRDILEESCISEEKKRVKIFKNQNKIFGTKIYHIKGAGVAEES